MMNDKGQLYPPGLVWQCRRGMLELDVLFEAFLKKAWLSLSKQEQSDFQDILSMSDTVLYAWLIGQDEIIPEEFSAIVQCIRQTYHRT